ELVADGVVIAGDLAGQIGLEFSAELESIVDGAGWVAARCMPTGGAGFAHTPPVRLRPSAGAGEVGAQLRALVEATREWAEVAGRGGAGAGHVRDRPAAPGRPGEGDRTRPRHARVPPDAGRTAEPEPDPRRARRVVRVVQLDRLRRPRRTGVVPLTGTRRDRA